MLNLNSTFSISPHNKIPVYYRTVTPPQPVPNQWIKHDMEKELATKYYPIGGEVIYCTRQRRCFRSSVCPISVSVRGCSRTDGGKLLTEDGWEKYLGESEGFLQLLKSNRMYINFQYRAELSEISYSIDWFRKMLEQCRDFKLNWSTYGSPRGSHFMICSLICFLWFLDRTSYLEMTEWKKNNI